MAAETGSIQLAGTFFHELLTGRLHKHRVVSAYGMHINRLRDALEEATGMGEERVEEEAILATH